MWYHVVGVGMGNDRGFKRTPCPLWLLPSSQQMINSKNSWLEFVVVSFWGLFQKQFSVAPLSTNSAGKPENPSHFLATKEEMCAQIQSEVMNCFGFVPPLCRLYTNEFSFGQLASDIPGTNESGCFRSKMLCSAFRAIYAFLLLFRVPRCILKLKRGQASLFALHNS